MLNCKPTCMSCWYYSSFKNFDEQYTPTSFWVLFFSKKINIKNKLFFLQYIKHNFFFGGSINQKLECFRFETHAWRAEQTGATQAHFAEGSGGRTVWTKRPAPWANFLIFREIIAISTSFESHFTRFLKLFEKLILLRFERQLTNICKLFRTTSPTLLADQVQNTLKRLHLEYKFFKLVDHSKFGWELKPPYSLPWLRQWTSWQHAFSSQLLEILLLNAFCFRLNWISFHSRLVTIKLSNQIANVAKC